MNLYYLKITFVLFGSQSNPSSRDWIWEIGMVLFQLGFQSWEGEGTLAEEEMK